MARFGPKGAPPVTQLFILTKSYYVILEIIQRTISLCVNWTQSYVRWICLGLLRCKSQNHYWPCNNTLMYGSVIHVCRYKIQNTKHQCRIIFKDSNIWFILIVWNFLTNVCMMNNSYHLIYFRLVLLINNSCSKENGDFSLYIIFV
jgi:hypothetical protein